MVMRAHYIRRSGRPLLAAMAALFLLLFSSTGILRAEGPGDYVGWKSCGVCHEKVATDWQKGRHAGAFANLQKSGQENLPACVRCHVTGHGQTGGFVDAEITPDLAGVQCEACHGPGRRHAASPGTGAIVPAPGIETCRRCHTPGQDPGFDYAKKVRGVHMPIAGTVRAGSVSLLTVLPDHFNFGTIDEGTPASTTVVLENTGEREMAITEVRTS